MYRFRIVFLLLISFYFLNACSPTIGLKAVRDAENRDFPAPPIAGKDFSTALYKTSISINKHYHTGIFLIKNNPVEKSFNIVLLSEFGLNLIEMRFKNDEIEIISCQDFLNHKIFTNNLKHSFEAILLDYRQCTNKKLYSDNENNIKVLKLKNKSSRYYYFCNQNNYIYKIVKKSILRKNLNIKIEFAESIVPKKIMFINEGIKMRMEMDLIKIK